MKFKNPLWIMFFIGTLIFSLSIVGGNSLNLKLKEVNGMFDVKKTLIRVKDSPSSNENVFFTMKNVKELDGRNVTFIASSATEIDSEPVRVFGTNSQYPDFVKTSFAKGCFFNKAAENDRVVVIDEKLAWNIFKSLNVVGHTLDIFNVKFRVVGVISPDKSIVGLLSDSGTPNAFIPASSLLNLDKTARITSLQIQNKDSNLSGQNYTDAENLLKQLGKTPNNYYISDFNIENVLLAQKPCILVFIIGLTSILLLLAVLIRRGRELYTYLQTKCQSEYIKEVLKHDKATLLRKLLIMLFLLSVIALFWTKIRFDMYIPPENTPTELTNLSFYFDLFKKGISENIAGRGYKASLLELRLNSILMLSNWLFYLGLLLGFPMVWISLWLSRWDNGRSLPRVLFTLSWSFAAAVSLSIIIVLLTGIPLSLQVIDLGIVYSFIYIYAVKSFNEGKDEPE